MPAKANLNRIRFLGTAVILLCILASALDAASLIMPLLQVKPGMKGIGKSVFQGNKVEEFEAEILGVLENIQPKKNIILARLRGRGLETTGVIQGMSGSPVYIDGKIIGAVAYSFPYAKEAIAGITPIEEMLAVEARSAQPKASLSASLPIQKSLSLEDLAGLYRSAFAAKSSSLSTGQAFVPLTLPLVFSGFSAGAFEKARPFFAGMGFQPVRGGSGSSAQSTEVLAGPALQEGDAVSVQLIAGDLDISALGTVTYVDGNKVLAFGHPFYNLGSVDYIMARANILAVMPSLENSFKMSSTGAMVGRISQDRPAGAFGEMGRLPQLIPLNINLEDSPGKRKEFRLKLVNDRILGPALVNIALSTLIQSEERVLGNLSLEFDGNVYLDKGLSVHLEDLFSGNYDNATANLSGLAAAVVYYLTNNEFQDVSIYRMDLNIRPSEEARFCTLDKVLLDKYEVSPGERMGVKITYRTFKQESLEEDVDLPAPDLPAGSEFLILVGDASAMQQVERSQYRNQDFVPRSLSQLIRVLSNLRKNNRVYIKILAAKPGLFLKGEEMPNLPPTLKSMFASPRASASSPLELTRSTLMEFQLPVPYVFRGAAAIPVRIRK